MNVKVVQRRLWEQSGKHRKHRELSLPLFAVDPCEGRAKNLMDLMHQSQWIAAACDRVLSRSRGKAGGVDRVTASEFRQNRRADLESLRLELKRGEYQPQPLRRTVIPKANGKLRKLGIPCLRDKIVQEAIRMALEPIYEVELHHSSYGFRHIKPVSCFANFAQANHLFNLQTLCLRCNKEKHSAKSSRHSGKPDAWKSCTSGLGLGPG